MIADCARFLDLLLESLDEPLASGEQQEFDGHLAGCPDCVAALKEHVVLRSTLRDLDHAPDVAPPPLPEGLVLRCLAAIRSARADTKPGTGGSARIA